MNKSKFDNQLVSVIMNCLNGEKYLKVAIDSVYAQTYKNWEIIFWNNQSTDLSVAIASTYDKRVRIFHSQKLMSLGEARNCAITKCAGEYIAFLDCDDIWLPDKLKKQITLFTDNPKTGLVFSNAFNFFEGDGTVVTHFDSFGFKPPRGKIFRYLLKHYALSMPTVIIRKKALFSQKEWFDNNFQICTDFDLFLRIAYAWECDYVNETLVMYRIHLQSQSDKLFQKISEERISTIKKFRDYYPEFEDQYAREINANLQEIAFLQGKACWRNKKTIEARRCFAKYILYKKMPIAYLLSFLPYKIIMRFIFNYKRMLRILFSFKICHNRTVLSKKFNF